MHARLLLRLLLDRIEGDVAAPAPAHPHLLTRCMLCVCATIRRPRRHSAAGARVCRFDAAASAKETAGGSLVNVRCVITLSLCMTVSSPDRLLRLRRSIEIPIFQLQIIDPTGLGSDLNLSINIYDPKCMPMLCAVMWTTDHIVYVIIN